MKRKIIVIDENLCNGCGNCVEGCHEGALQMIDGKARMVSDLYCDGLGACIGECPVGAITIEEREALPYDENAVMDRISPKGEKTILAHLKHLKDHDELELVDQGIEYIKKHQLKVDLSMLEDKAPQKPSGCPGSMARSFSVAKPAGIVTPSPNRVANNAHSELTHWPIQLHLLNPQAGFLANEDLLVAADCTAFSYPDFHSRFLKNKKLAIACPKLDTHKEIYVEKLVTMIDVAMINTLTVIIMEVPCCNGLLQLAMKAQEKAIRKVPIKKIVIGIKGNIVDESWI